tara:strand:- start:416 stop:1039 length:624 start_codon:yes stop_codon:yes gene_type:complete
MSSLSHNHNISRRSLTFNKSFIISVIIHLLIIFGISITTYYKLPIFKESQIINVKFANSNQDSVIKTNNLADSKSNQDLTSMNIENNKKSNNISKSFKIKKLKSNSKVNSDEAIYLNLWQRKIESTGDNVISNEENVLNGKVQILASIDLNGNLVNSKILISSGNAIIDNMAIKILEDAAPFSPFNETMSNEYSILEIVRDWNFSSN